MPLDEFQSLENLRIRVAKEIDSQLSVTARVTLVEPKSIARQIEGKTRRVVDKRRM
jgi:phenylacetate-CoA ligase